MQRGHAAAVAWFAGLTELPSVPGLVVMELIQGAKDTRQVREALQTHRPTANGVADNRRLSASVGRFHGLPPFRMDLGYSTP